MTNRERARDISKRFFGPTQAQHASQDRLSALIEAALDEAERHGREQMRAEMTPASVVTS